MAELKSTVYKGVIVLMIIISSGATWYIQDAGTKTSCAKGFQLVDSGEYEGYYRCTTTSGDRYELCYEVYNSSSTANYWCKKGIKIATEIETPVVYSKYNCTYYGCKPMEVN